MKPNKRSAITAMNTTPAASETWITDIGASESAATCSPQLAVAMSMPSANHFEEYSCPGRAQRMAHVTRGTELAPRYLIEEAEVRHEGADKGEDDAEIKRHGLVEPWVVACWRRWAGLGKVHDQGA